MKKMNKKGFTIVELVIVIAVIAILAAVLIPTFSGVVSKANHSSALQKAHNALTLALQDQEDGALDNNTYVVVDDKYTFVYSGNTIEEITAESKKVTVKGQTTENSKTTTYYYVNDQFVTNTDVYITNSDQGQLDSSATKSNYKAVTEAKTFSVAD